MVYYFWEKKTRASAAVCQSKTRLMRSTTISQGTSLLSQRLSQSALTARVTAALECKYVQLVFVFPVGAFVPTCALAAVTTIIPLQRPRHSSGRIDSQAPKARRSKGGSEKNCKRTQQLCQTHQTQQQLSKTEMSGEVNEWFSGGGGVNPDRRVSTTKM